MASLEYLSNCLTKMAAVLEQYQARCQGTEIELNLPNANAENYPTLTFSPDFLAAQQQHFQTTASSEPIKYLFSTMSEHSLGKIDLILIDNSKNSKKPLGDSNLRKMRKLLPEIPKKQIAERIQFLIAQGRIIDYAKEMNEVSKVILPNEKNIQQ